MAILDQYGNAITSHRFFPGAVNNYGQSRPYIPVKLSDIDQLLPASDWRVVLGVSRKMFAGMPIVAAGIEMKAEYSVGEGWDLRFRGEDTEWGKRAIELLQEEWFNVCDISGPNFDFKKLLDLDSIALDRDGDYFILLTQTRSGYPKTQRIPAHRIGNRYSKIDNIGGAEYVKNGRFAGFRICNGVVKNRDGEVVAYHYLGDTEDKDRMITAGRAVHNFDPDWYGQSRGIPVLQPALNMLRDSLQSDEWERQAMLMISSMGLIEYNDYGGPDPNDDANILTGQTANNSGIVETDFAGGMVKYFRANSGNKLEAITHDRPGDVWDRFQNRIWKASLACAGIPFSIAYEATGQGTAERSDIKKFQRTLGDRQRQLRRAALRVIRWATAKMIEIGRLDQPSNPSDWLKLDFKMPPEFTIDDGRDAKRYLELWRAGVINQSELVSKISGCDLDEHLAERAREVIDRKRIAAETAAGTGFEITDEEMCMMTANGNLNGGKTDETE